ncbi:MAG: hypothetical protein KDK02_12685 [Rhodobacteraceae bacterium]|nr:hypothetical protein [Paracoccaceae bacterium]
MKPKARFIESVTQTALSCDVQMPWTRGTRRVEFISRRTAKPEERACG